MNWDDAWIYTCGQPHHQSIGRNLRLAGFQLWDGRMVCPCGKPMIRYKDYVWDREAVPPANPSGSVGPPPDDVL